ncbi:MAG: HlyD family efflux transporter periplasmic adaptor subunit [bacterium]|nr:HlyD family efflux transporter periplasmic adaptor subunit [bacterium]
MKINLREKIKRLKKPQRKTLIIATVMIVVIGGGILLWRHSQQKNAATNNQETLVTANLQNLQEVVEVSGTISNANYTEVTTQAIGTVATVYIQDGQTVQAGDKLFELELSPEGKEAYQSAYASYLNAKNSLASAENKLNSLQITLFEKNQYFLNHADAEDLEEDDPTYIEQWAAWKAAENDYKNQSNNIAQAQAQVNSAYQTYQNTSAIVTAPVSGVIENITAVPGLVFGSVSSGSGTSLSERMATIKTNDNILASFSLSSSDIGKVKIDQKVIITTDDDQEFTGKIVSVDRYGTTGTTTTYTVIAQFDSTDATALLPNLSVDGQIYISERENVITIPTLAITTAAGVSSVQVKNAQGQTETRTVEIGVSSGNLTEIISGISEGEQIIFSLSEFSSSSKQNNMGGGMMMMGGNMGGGGTPPQDRNR